MKNHLALLGMLAFACTGDAGTKDSGGDTGTGDCAAEDFYTGPVAIDEYSVDCSGDEVTFSARTVGWTDGGYVFSQETGNSSSGGQWSDEHEIPSVTFDSCGNWDELERTISTGASVDSWQENVSTVFTCEDHFGDGNVMTHAFAVVDIDGAFADCVVYGDDPNGLINGDYDRVNDPAGFNESQCSVGESTM